MIQSFKCRSKRNELNVITAWDSIVIRIADSLEKPSTASVYLTIKQAEELMDLIHNQIIKIEEEVNNGIYKIR
jgi:hypothetical protein